MARFNGATLTKLGRAVLVKALTGKPLNFSHVFVGDGYKPEDKELTDMEALSHPVCEMTIQAIEIPEKTTGTVTIRAVLSNQDLETGFFIREIGLFATDPDTGEDVLYSYCNASDEADFMPAKGGGDVVEYLFNLVVVVDQATNVTATLAEGLVFVTHPELQRRINLFFADPEPVRYFWTRTDGDDRTFRPASLETVKMVINGVPTKDMQDNEIDQLAEASILQSLSQAYERQKTRDDLAQEKAERIAADEAEQAARIAADEAEQAARIAADKAEATARANADKAEETARKSADTTLQNNINAEATARSNADNSLQNSINSEASTRASADSSLQSSINNEANTRASADSSLQGDIATVATNLANHINTGGHAFSRITGYLSNDQVKTASIGIDKINGDWPLSRVSGTLSVGNIDTNGLKSNLESWVKGLSVGISEASLGNNGYVKFSNGLMVEWGVIPAVSNDTRDYAVNFHKAFPNVCFCLAGCIVDTTNRGTGSDGASHDFGNMITMRVKSLSKTGFTLYFHYFERRYIAIGY